MQLTLPFVTTAYIPSTRTYLQQFLPSVLKTECFNDLNLPFEEEVLDTEIGHLFEHILIDQLSRFEIEAGKQRSVINGRTFWNWQKNPLGSFEIWIDVGKDKLKTFLKALYITIKLMEDLIKTVYTYTNISLNQNLRAAYVANPQI